MNITVEGGKSKKLLTGGKYCPEDITVTAEGGAPIAVEEKDVNFYDYDGTCLYAYTIAEAQALTELPPLPSHEGLICQGWNWSLEQLLEWNYYADIGALYITDNGETRIHLRIDSLLRMPMTLHFSQTAANGVEVDFGNGEGVRTISGTGNVSMEFSFSSVGHYVIRMKAVSGTFAFSNGMVFGGDYAHTNSITEINLGENMTALGSNAFRYAFSMTTCTFPRTTANPTISTGALRQSGIRALILHQCITGSSACYDCEALRVISWPLDKESTSLLSNGFVRDSTSIRRLVITWNADEIQPYFASACPSLTGMYIKIFNASTIPSSFISGAYSLQEFEVAVCVTKIDPQAFYNCYSMKKLRFLPTTPPAVSNANAFTGIPTDCVVEVPAESLEAYQNATNYSGIAAQMVGV